MTTDAELLEARTQRWHLNGQPVRTLDDARAFLESAGFCVMYPTRPAILLPTFVGAWVGADDRLPMQQHAYNDARAKDATELMVRMLRAKAAYEAPLNLSSGYEDNNPFLLAASVFPYFYALVGERVPKYAPAPGPRSPYSQLACDVFAVVREKGPISKTKLGEIIGSSVSMPGLDRALAELWAKLRITRVDYSVEEGSVWDELSRWAPDAVGKGVAISLPEALSALISKYLDCMVAAEEAEIQNFLSHFVARTRVQEAIRALLSARELSYVSIGGKSLLQVTPPRQAFVPRPRPVRVS